MLRMHLDAGHDRQHDHHEQQVGGQNPPEPTPEILAFMQAEEELRLAT